MSELELTREHRRMLAIPSYTDSAVNRHLALNTGNLPTDPKLGHQEGSAIQPKLHLGDYIEAQAEAPAQVQRGTFAGYTDILGNDQWGDCGDAMTLHGIEGIRHAVGEIPPPFVTQDALALYSAVSGFNPDDGGPGENPTDQGTDNTELVHYWQKTGVTCAADQSVHKIVGSIAVDSSNDLQCQIAIYEFAALFCAWGLPLTAQGKRIWDAVKGAGAKGKIGSWGYHDTVCLAYTGTELDDNSWGLTIPVTKAFRTEYAAGFFAVLGQDLLNRQGVSPSGLNWTKLTADFHKVLGESK